MLAHETSKVSTAFVTTMFNRWFRKALWAYCVAIAGVAIPSHHLYDLVLANGALQRIASYIILLCFWFKITSLW
jgi:hypothetical protein